MFKENNLTIKAKKFLEDLLSLVTFLSHCLAGYMLHDNSNIIVSAVGVILLILAITKLVNMSFNKEQ
jgi:fatty-acid desaturase